MNRIYARVLTVAALLAATVLGVVSVVPAEASQASVWTRLAQCESGGNWHINTGNGYYGGLQFAHRTWQGFGGGQYGYNAHQASRNEQILIAQRTLAEQGWGAWPTCSRRIGVR